MAGPTVVPLKQRAPQATPAQQQLASRLRELADMAEAGEVADFTACYAQSSDHDYDFINMTSKHQALVMAAMMYDNAIRAMRAP